LTGSAPEHASPDYFILHFRGKVTEIGRIPHYKKLLEATEAKDGNYASYIMEQL